jgi:hypothetical protein
MAGMPRLTPHPYDNTFSARMNSANAPCRVCGKTFRHSIHQGEVTKELKAEANWWLVFTLIAAVIAGLLGITGIFSDGSNSHHHASHRSH